MNKSNLIHIYRKKLYIIEKSIFGISLFSLGFLLSRIPIIGNYPFGVALIASAPGGISLISSIFGVLFGYISEINISVSVRYISTLASVCVVRWVFDDLKKYSKFSFLITFVPVFITGIAIKLAYNLTFMSFVECILESILTSGIYFLLKQIFEYFNTNKFKYECILFSFILFAIFSPIVNLNFFSINIINSLLTFIVLVCSYKFGISGGSISGIIHAIFYMIFSPNNSIKIMSSSISGMISGYTSKFGKYYVSLVYVISDLIVHFQLNSNILVSHVLEELFGSAIFLLFAEKINFKLITNYENRKIYDTQDISVISNSFSEVQTKFEKISNALDKKYRSDSKTMLSYYLKSIPRICKSIINSISVSSELNENLTHKIKKMIKSTFNIDSKVSLKIVYQCKYMIQIELENFNNRDISILEEELFYTCGRSFMTPEVFRNERSIVLKFCERPNFKLRVQSKQHISRGESNCGDCFKTFYDGLGNFYSVISDGMGKGNLASISGNITVQIIKNMLRSGVDVETSIFIANSILMEKSSDESLATLDILRINLFTGESFFVKLGSASSFIKTHQKVSKISSSVPPIGILSEINFKKSEFQVQMNDTVIMMSDGITDTGEDWVKNLIERSICGSNLTKNIIEKTKIRRKNSSDDDMTVITIEITSY